MATFFCFGAVSVHAATYYVSTDGDDSNDGLSVAAPWQTLSQIESFSNSVGFEPGDTILFRRGDIWREQFSFHSDGTSENPITFGAYGSGDNPVLSASLQVETFASLADTEAADGLFTDGFESGNTDIYNSVTVADGNVATTSSDVVNNGVYAFKTIFGGGSSNQNSRLNKNVDSSDDVYARAYFYLDDEFDLASSDQRFDILMLREGTGDRRARVSLSQADSGEFYLTGRLEEPFATIYEGTPGEIQRGEWFSIEVRYKGNDASGGGVEFWLNNVSLASNYSYNTNGLRVDRVEIGASSSGQTEPTEGSVLYIDDIKVDTAPVGNFVPAGPAEIYAVDVLSFWTPRQVLVDGGHLANAASYADMTAGTFYHSESGDRLYVWLLDDADPNEALVEVGRFTSVSTLENRSHLVFNNLTFSGNNTVSFGALTIDNSSYIAVANSVFENNFGTGLLMRNNSTFNRVSTSTFLANSRPFGGAVRIDTGSSDNIVEYNTMSGLVAGERTGSGIYVRGDASESSRNILRYNRVYDMFDSGIYITTNANENEVYGNVIYQIDDHEAGTVGGNGIHIGNVAGGGDPYSHGNKIFNNIVYDVATHGISLREGTHSNLVYNNTVFDVGVNRGEVSGNEASGSGINLHSTSQTTETGPSNNRIFNNVVSTCATRCLNVDNHAVAAGGNVADYNIYYQPSPSHILVRWDTTQYTSLEPFQTATGQDTHSTSTDPLFVNQEEANFSLESTSPARDTATSTLGAAYRFAFSPEASVPDNVVLADQNNFGSGWDKGAIVYTTSEEVLEITNVTVSAIGTSTAEIGWTTNLPATSRVEYGPTGYTATTSLSAPLVTEHAVLLVDLTPDTTYNFRVRSVDAAHNLAVSLNDTFTTLKEEEQYDESEDEQPSSLTGGGGGRGGGSVTQASAEPTSSPEPSPETASTDSPLIALFATLHQFLQAPLPTDRPALLERLNFLQNVLHELVRLLPAGSQSAGTPQPEARPVFTRDLTIGSRGEDVRALQVFLNKAGYVVSRAGPGSPGQETDYFGFRTAAALADFQRARGITPAAGYFGPRTRTLVNSQ